MDSYVEFLVNHSVADSEDATQQETTVNLDDIRNMQLLVSAAIVADAKAKVIAKAKKAERKKKKRGSAVSCLKYQFTVEGSDWGALGIYLNSCNSYVTCKTRGHVRRNRPNPYLKKGIGEFQIPLTDQPNCWFS